MKRTPEDGPEEVALQLTREESLESAGHHGEEREHQLKGTEYSLALTQKSRRDEGEGKVLLRLK